jgi:glycosyltransferase involved in cell wall biosynthesis
MRFHIVSLPHTQTTDEYLPCAYTQKIVKFCRMMEDTEHEVVLYASEDNNAPCNEYVQIVTKRQQRRWFGKPQPDLMYPITWNPIEDHWIDTNRAVIKHIKRGLREGKYDKRDLLLIIAGTCNQQIDLHLPLTSVEYGVGYTGVFTHAAYESVSHRHSVYSMRGIGDGRSFDTVIPNYFDPKEFTASVAGNAERGDHLLYVGRVIVRKGVHVAAKVAEACGRKLLVAGQGVLEHKTGEFITSEEMTLRSPNIEFIGTLGVEERAYEMGRAHAVLAPTQYVEPFGGVAVEAGFSGTPVITTNWGAYTETVSPGVTGFRPDTLSEFVDAVNACGRLDPVMIRKVVEEEYSLEAVRPQFEEWFRKLDTLWDAGWYEGYAHLQKRG